MDRILLPIGRNEYIYLTDMVQTGAHIAIIHKQQLGRQYDEGRWRQSVKTKNYT